MVRSKIEAMVSIMFLQAFSSIWLCSLLNARPYMNVTVSRRDETKSHWLISHWLISHWLISHWLISHWWDSKISMSVDRKNTRTAVSSCSPMTSIEDGHTMLESHAALVICVTACEIAVNLNYIHTRGPWVGWWPSSHGWMNSLHKVSKTSNPWMNRSKTKFNSDSLSSRSEVSLLHVSVASGSSLPTLLCHLYRDLPDFGLNISFERFQNIF